MVLYFTPISFCTKLSFCAMFCIPFFTLFHIYLSSIAYLCVQQKRDIDCLENDKLNDFTDFEIKFEVNPL